MFCLDYYPFQKYVEGAEELKIKYRPSDRTLEDFLEKFKDKSIVINVSESFEETDAIIFKELSKKFGNIRIMFDFSNNDHLELAQKYEIPFFFTNHISTIDELTGLLAYKPTDMYICEELGFSIDKVSKILHEHNVRVRVYPNICQSSFYGTPSIKTFFIRPEDIDVYSIYVDVFELVSDEARQEMIYKIYKEGKWFGKLNEIIPTYKGDLDSRYMLLHFGVVRTSCGKRCQYKPGSCEICNRFIELSDTLKNNNIVVHKNSN